MEKHVIKINEEQLAEIVKSTIKENIIRQKKEEKIDFDELFHFNTIPEEELEEQYMDLAFSVSSSGYGGRFIGVNGKILKEDATTTLSIDETKKQIQTKFHLKDWQFATQTVANGVRLVVLYPGILKNTKLIKDAMLACGWSLAIKGYTVKNKMIWRAMSFDPIFQKDVSNEARKYNYLFHWTPLYYYDTIVKEGLKPRSENKLFDYPNRLLIKGNTPKQDIYSIGWQLCMANRRHKNKGYYVLLPIDLSKVPTDTEIYYDPRYEWGYYTKVPIQSDAITPILGHNFKTKQDFQI